MARRQLLLIIGPALVSTLVLAGPTFAAPTNCGIWDAAGGTGCPSPTPSVTDDRVDLSVDVTVGDSGSEGASRGERRSGGGSSSAGAPSTSPPPPPPCPGSAIVNGWFTCDLGYNTLVGGPAPNEPTDPIAGRTITLSDIASFRATPGSQVMEPDGWIVVGLDTNFYASASQHTRSGSLLGRPAEVRFTPVAYRWQYGDGHGRATAAPGASWSTLGLPEFSPTTTSHVYAAAGIYVIRLTVHYSAEYRWAGSGWVPISGTLAVPANELVATAGDIRTVLVARDCAQNPSGPGC